MFFVLKRRRTRRQQKVRAAAEEEKERAEQEAMLSPAARRPLFEPVHEAASIERLELDGKGTRAEMEVRGLGKPELEGKAATQELE